MKNNKKYMNGSYRILMVLLLGFSSLLFCACSGEKKAEKPQKGKLVLTTKPERAKIMLAGRVQKKVTPAEYMVPPGVYIIKYSLGGYRTVWKRAEVKAGQVCTVSADLSPETASLLVAAKAGGKYGVRVTYNNKLMGETPIVLRNLPAGRGEVLLSKSGYSFRRIPFIVESSLPPPAITTDLQSNRGELTIRSIPESAEVFLNGKRFGITPFTESVEEGKYTLELRKNGYHTYTKILEIKRGTDHDLKNIRLQQLPAALQISSKPSGAKIYLNGEYRGNTPGKFMSLKPGKYVVRLEKDNFDYAQESILLNGGETKRLSLKLDTVMGVLEIVTKPAGVSVYVDGKMIGRSKPDPANPKYSEVIRIPNIRQGEHTVKISHKRARRPANGSLTKKVMVKKGETVRVDQIELWIPDIKIVRKSGQVIEGRFLYNLEDGGVYCESSPGIRYAYKKEWIRRIEKLPMEDE